jgi:hypothetical protein
MSQRQLRITGRVGSTVSPNTNSGRCNKCGGIKPKAAAPAQAPAPAAPAPAPAPAQPTVAAVTGWTLEAARTARQGLVALGPGNRYAGRVIDLIDTAYPQLRVEASVPAMPSMIDQVKANRAGEVKPDAGQYAFLPHAKVAAEPAGTVPKMPSMTDEIKARK